LKGIEVRLEKLQHSLTTDQQRQNQLQPYWQKLMRQLDSDPEVIRSKPAWLHYRWMLEEMRISLFAQNLKTSMPVSNKRLDEQLAIIKKA
jgi:ATP-dependent helicase HrpA